MIFGDRIKQARELKGWTQTELADRLKVTQSFVAQMEGNHLGSAPSSEMISGLVFHLGFPPSFFEQPPNDDFPLGSLLFRSSKSTMTARDRQEIYRWAQVSYDLYRAMTSARNIKEIPLHVPRCRESPETAAAVTRSELGLGPDTPIPNLINTMEKAGVLVFALPLAFEGRDAFSLWTVGPEGSRKPIVVVTADTPADRLRGNLAHELGHLVMHQPISFGIGDIEKQAKQFQGAFLLPESAMRQEIHSPVTLDTLLNLKIRWGVSIQALMTRAKELEIITPRKYSALYARMGARGWVKREPLSREVAMERPRAMRQIAEVVYGSNLDYKRIAADARMREDFVKELLKQYAPRSRKPSAAVPPEVRTSPRKKVIAFAPKTKQ